MLYTQFFVVVTLALHQCVYGQDAAVKTDKEEVQSNPEETNSPQLLAKEHDSGTQQSEETPAVPEDSVPEVKAGFPPYNYTPTELAKEVDYDLDATPDTQDSTEPHNVARVPGEAIPSFLRKVYNPDKQLDYIMYLGMVLLFGLGVILGRFTLPGTSG